MSISAVPQSDPVISQKPRLLQVGSDWSRVLGQRGVLGGCDHGCGGESHVLFWFPLPSLSALLTHFKVLSPLLPRPEAATVLWHLCTHTIGLQSNYRVCFL